ncbi:hypothetical protein VTI74DRAFT_419 [Chaetomium olivicolor]
MVIVVDRVAGLLARLTSPRFFVVPVEEVPSDGCCVRKKASSHFLFPTFPFSPFRFPIEIVPVHLSPRNGPPSQTWAGFVVKGGISSFGQYWRQAKHISVSRQTAQRCDGGNLVIVPGAHQRKVKRAWGGDGGGIGVNDADVRSQVLIAISDAEAQLLSPLS